MHLFEHLPDQLRDLLQGGFPVPPCRVPRMGDEKLETQLLAALQLRSEGTS